MKGGKLPDFSRKYTNKQMATKSTILNINFAGKYPYCCSFQNLIFVWVTMPHFRDGQVEKWSQN